MLSIIFNLLFIRVIYLKTQCIKLSASWGVTIIPLITPILQLILQFLSKVIFFCLRFGKSSKFFPLLPSNECENQPLNKAIIYQDRKYAMQRPRPTITAQSLVVGSIWGSITGWNLIVKVTILRCLEDIFYISL